jgi:hypothetical protein
MHRLWIGLQVPHVLGLFMGALSLLVLWLHLWAFPVIGYDGNTHTPAYTASAGVSAAPTR